MSTEPATADHTHAADKLHGHARDHHPHDHTHAHHHGHEHGKAKSDHLHKFGAGIGLACAIHCLAMPLIVGVLPMLGLSFLAEESTETWIVGATLLVSVAGALWGFHRHRALRIVMTFAGAIGLLLIGRWLGEAHPLGLPLTIGGSITIAIAHLWGARLCRSCPTE